jgi:hypothetical protein
MIVNLFDLITHWLDDNTNPPESAIKLVAVASWTLWYTYLESADSELRVSSDPDSKIAADLIDSLGPFYTLKRAYSRLREVHSDEEIQGLEQDRAQFTTARQCPASGITPFVSALDLTRELCKPGAHSQPEPSPAKLHAGITLSLAARHARRGKISALAMKRLRVEEMCRRVRVGVSSWKKLPEAMVSALETHSSLLFVAIFTVTLTEDEFEPYLRVAAADMWDSAHESELFIVGRS